MRRCLAFALLALACPLALAQAYKWKDAQGITHYADAPPPGNTKFEQVKIATGAASNATPAPPPAATVARPAAAAGTADTPANRKALCEQLRKNADLLKNEKVLNMDDGKGGTKAVDDATRQNEIKKNQAQVTLYCAT
ncbi:DUF4124 domain-containing protein [Luteibacter sp. PPL552]